MEGDRDAQPELSIVPFSAPFSRRRTFLTLCVCVCACRIQMSFLQAVSVFTHIPHIHGSEICWDRGHNIPSYLRDAWFRYHLSPVLRLVMGEAGLAPWESVLPADFHLLSLSLAPSSSCGAWSLATTAKTRRHSSLLLILMSKLSWPGRACDLPFLRTMPIFCYKTIPSGPCLWGQPLPR